MTTKTFRADLVLNVAVEANSKNEAERIIRRLALSLNRELPTGVRMADRPITAEQG